MDIRNFVQLYFFPRFCWYFQHSLALPVKNSQYLSEDYADSHWLNRNSLLRKYFNDYQKLLQIFQIVFLNIVNHWCLLVPRNHTQFSMLFETASLQNAWRIASLVTGRWTISILPCRHFRMKQCHYLLQCHIILVDAISECGLRLAEIIQSPFSRLEFFVESIEFILFLARVWFG
jgi:hypothetical protein